MLNKEWESAARLKNLTEKAMVITLREQELKKDIARLQTEEGVKEEIKERFSVIQEDERVAVIVDDRGVSSSTDTSTLPWYKRFWIVIMRDK